jgi:ribosome production factor 2
MVDLCAMRQPLAKRLTKKNAIHPFEDASSLEFLSEKNDASLLVFGSSSKKRPHTLTLCRTFDHKVLDMLELYLDPESFRRINQFKTKKFAVGLRPMLVFAGTAFESPVRNEWTIAKGLLLDFFRGDSNVENIDVESLQYVVVISAEEESANRTDDGVKPAIHLRVYLIRTKRSGQHLPRVEIEEMGPRMDFRLGRMREPEEAVLKEAMRKAKTTEERAKKNISTDVVGDKIGRIHLVKQDLSQQQTRKMKGLKRRRDEDDKIVGDDEPKRKTSSMSRSQPKF